MRLHGLFVLASLLCVRCYDGGNESAADTGEATTGTGSGASTGASDDPSDGPGDGPSSEPTTGASQSGPTGEPGTGSDDSGPSTTSATSSPTTGESESSSDDSSTGEPPGEPAIHYVGRHDDSDPAHVRMGWSGVGAVLRFTGTGASVRLDDKAKYFTVVVDGALQPTLATTPGEQLYPLAQGLPDGEHTIELYRRTEGNFGPTVIAGFELEGELLAPPPVSRRIEIVGDSITCGYGNEGVSPCSFSPETENHYLTYGAVAARALGAELSTVAWSGKGVVYNYDDNKTDPMPSIYDRLLAVDGAPWSFAWQPDAVVINLGTNDFSTDDDPPEGVFVPAYVEFLEHIRSLYPDAFILVVSPSLWGAEADLVDGYLQSVVDQRNADGDLEVAFKNINVEWIGSGCDGHPSVATHAGMAANLTEALKTELGW